MNDEKLTYERMKDFIGDLWCCGRPDLLEACMAHEDWEWIKPQLKSVFEKAEKYNKMFEYEPPSFIVVTKRREE